MSDPIDRMQKSWSDMMAISRLETEIARLRTLLSEAEQREKGARAKALEEAAMRVDKLISDMQGLEKFNRSYALRMTALAAKDIRALQSEER